ncbi:hypothetical protein D6774_03550 [Candidatus Woesearchaeota archaeon]|nr:MAG: hypothetical protein D6774_03550 [Candidatus Woesearchaeota archaeon]
MNANTVLKMMKTSTLLLIALFLITSCTPASSVFSGKTNIGDLNANTQFRTGVSSLEFAFLQGLPPDQIYINEPFNIGVVLQNNGAYDIEEGLLVVSGFESTAYTFSETKKSFSALGRSAYRSEGERTQIIFDARAECFPAVATGQIANQTANFRITACYPYQSIASAEICIDPDPNQQNQGDCVSRPITLSGGQGGPVGVTQITPSVSFFKGAAQITVRAQIEHLNKDEEVYSPAFFETQCNDVKERGKIVVEMSIAGQRCDPQLVTLEQGRAIASCTFNLESAASAYTTPVAITLKYSVAKSALKTVSVVKPFGVDVPECSGSIPLTFEQANSQTGSQKGSVDCRSEPNGVSCGDNLVCHDGRCISECTRDYGAQGFSCMPKTQGSKCVPNLCPDAATNSCCLPK